MMTEDQAEWLAGKLETMAGEVRRQRPDRVTLDDQHHTVEVEPRSGYRQHEDGGPSRWMVDIRWDLP